MIRSRLNNCFNKNRTDENWSVYKTQSNFCTEFFRKTKKDYLNLKLVLGNNIFGELLNRISQTKVTFLTRQKVGDNLSVCELNLLP